MEAVRALAAQSWAMTEAVRECDGTGQRASEGMMQQSEGRGGVGGSGEA